MSLSLNFIKYSLLNYICEIYSKNISAKTCLEKIKYILLIVFYSVGELLNAVHKQTGLSCRLLKVKRPDSLNKYIRQMMWLQLKVLIFSHYSFLKQVVWSTFDQQYFRNKFTCYLTFT